MGVRARVRVRHHDELSEVTHFLHNEILVDVVAYFFMLWRMF